MNRYAAQTNEASPSLPAVLAAVRNASYFAKRAREPVALVFKGEPVPLRINKQQNRMHFMGLPAVQTLLAGLLQVAHQHTVAYGGGCLDASGARPGDLVVFVGTFNFRFTPLARATFIDARWQTDVLSKTHRCTVRVPCTSHSTLPIVGW